eukprot:g41542.t1
MEEDSDSSPSRRHRLEEVKQQRKARHRSHGPLLPTIEDSSEEEELREEEELLREQEKMREVEQHRIRSTARKAKRDKEELRAQRRRERSKTPPSNLSPIEDASPTEELRQAAEMEELHRSSCSEYSPTMDSEAEGFEITTCRLYKSGSEYNLPSGIPDVRVTQYFMRDMQDQTATPIGTKVDTSHIVTASYTTYNKKSAVTVATAIGNINNAISVSAIPRSVPLDSGFVTSQLDDRNIAQKYYDNRAQEPVDSYQYKEPMATYQDGSNLYKEHKTFPQKFISDANQADIGLIQQQQQLQHQAQSQQQQVQVQQQQVQQQTQQQQVQQQTQQQ